MPEQTYHQEEMMEIDLKELIMLLWNKKWFIIGLVILAVAAAFLYSQVFVDVQHEARSEVLIMPPRYTEIEVTRLPVETYRSLAMSDRILKQIIEEEDLRNSEGELITPSSLERRLSVSIDQMDADEVALFKLSVTGTDAEEASQIANTWAYLFMEDTLQIRQAETEEIFRVTTNRFQETTEILDQKREEMKQLREEIRFEQLIARQETFQESLSEYESELLDLKQVYGKMTAEKNHLDSTIALMTDEKGNWIGDLSTGNLNNSSEIDPGIYRSVSNYKKTSARLLQFRQENDLSALRQQYFLNSYKLMNTEQQLFNLKANYNQVRAENEKLQLLLNEESQHWQLEKSFTEDVLWNHIFSQEEMQFLSGLSFSEQIVNPVYEKLRDQLAFLDIQSSSLPVQISYLEEEIAIFALEQDELRLQINQLEESERQLISDLLAYRDIYDNARKLYQDLLQSYAALAVEIDGIQSEIDYREESMLLLENDLNEIEDILLVNEMRKEVLEREINELQNTYDRLSGRAEDARLAQAEQTSDVRFVAEAVPPGRTIGRNTKLNVAIAAVLALMIGVFLVFFIDFLKDESAEEEENLKA